MPFFAETPILESILTILLNFFFSETKNRKVLFFCFAFNQSSSQILAIKHDYKEYFSVFFLLYEEALVKSARSTKKQAKAFKEIADNSFQVSHNIS